MKVIKERHKLWGFWGKKASMLAFIGGACLKAAAVQLHSLIIEFLTAATLGILTSSYRGGKISRAFDFK